MEPEQPQGQSEATEISDNGEKRSAADLYAAAGTTRSPMKSPTKTDSSHAILCELQKMTSRFGQIEKQAAADRAVIAGLVKRLDEPQRLVNTLSTPGLSTTQGNIMQNVTSDKDETQHITPATDNIANVSAMPGNTGGQQIRKSQPSTQSQVTDMSHIQAVNVTEVTTNRSGSNVQVPQGVYQL